MKSIVVFSDIHGHFDVVQSFFQQVLQQKQQFELSLSLGDIVGFGCDRILANDKHYQKVIYEAYAQISNKFPGNLALFCLGGNHDIQQRDLFPLQSLPNSLEQLMLSESDESEVVNQDGLSWSFSLLTKNQHRKSELSQGKVHLELFNRAPFDAFLCKMSELHISNIQSASSPNSNFLSKN